MNNMNKISIYDLNPRYFKDSTSTGVGDLKGLSSKFGYFSFLGVDAIIIQDLISSGINSELKSFQNVAHELGDLNDFKLLESHAKKNNVKIFIELKIGGIKESHSWYSIAKEEMTLKNGTLVDFKNSKDKIPLTAKYDKDVNAYISIDEATQEIPLNWNSERTIQKFIEVIRFWKDLGVSGFVLKDFEFISNKTRTASMSVETLTELRKFYRAIKLVDADIIVIAKSGIVPLEDILDFTIGKNKVFDYFQTTKLSMHGTGSKFGNDEIGKFKPKKLFSDISKISINPSIIMAFGTENSGRITSRWGDDGQYREASAKSLALLSFLTPASNTIYYADELGAKNIGLTHLDNFQDKTLKQR
ncbi:MAG: hypothetical protein KAG14_02705, partial [Mycoplasmataceae bacterium]|nr:hypothetical protein [Mycoplasmataceae bacterium]